LNGIHISKLAKLWLRNWNVQDARRLSDIRNRLEKLRQVIHKDRRPPINNVYYILGLL